GCTRRDLQVGIAEEKSCSDFSVRFTACRTRGVEEMHRAAESADLQSEAKAERQFREAQSFSSRIQSDRIRAQIGDAARSSGADVLTSRSAGIRGFGLLCRWSAFYLRDQCLPGGVTVIGRPAEGG